MERSLYSILFDFDDQESTPFNPFEAPVPAETTSTHTAPDPDASAPTALTNTPAASPSQPPPSSEQSPAQEPPQSESGKTEPGKMLVCAGAMCVCDKAASPNPVKLQVLTHQKFFINDADGTEKLLATTKEKDILALNFNQCKVPGPSKPVPCSAQLEWKDFYEGVELPGQAYVLTEKSTAVCTAKGGQITIKTHGQQINITNEHIRQANTSLWPAINPLVEQADVTILQTDSDEIDQPGIGVKKIAPQTGKTLYPPGSCVDFVVKEFYKGDASAKKGINWAVYDSKAKLLVEHSDIGPIMSATFKKAGEYIIEAYGNTRQADKQIKKAATCRIKIQENGLSAVKISGDKTLVRLNDPLTFTAGLLFSEELAPLPGQQVSQTSWKVGKVDGHGNLKENSLVVLEDSQGQVLKGATVSKAFASEGRYVLLASLDRVTHRSKVFQVIHNYVKSIQVSQSSCRVGDKVHLSVKDGWAINPALSEETARIQWTCKDENGQPVADFHKIGQDTLDYIFKKEGKYTITAIAITTTVNATAHKASVNVEVVQPELTHACWKGVDGSIKTITGWEEKSKVSLTFKACDGLKMDIDLYVQKPDQPANPVLLAKLVKDVLISGDHYSSPEFVLDSGKFAAKVADGDSLFFVLKAKTWGYSIEKVLKKENYLRVKNKQEVTSIAFYLAGSRVLGVNYGDSFKGRVYARNLVGKQVRINLYRIEKRAGHDWLQADSLISTHSCTIQDSGYGEFELTLQKAGEYSDTIHYFRAEVVHGSWWTTDYEQGQAGSAHKTTVNKSVLLFARQDSEKGCYPPTWVTIEQSGHRDKNETCPRCTAKLTKAELQKLFPNLKKDEDLFAKTRERYKNKKEYKTTLPDYTLDAFVNELNKTMEEFEINTCRRKAYFLAQIAIETGDLQDIAENITEAKANEDYGTDGFKFRGRGLIQVTFKKGYERFGTFCGKDFITDPDTLLDSLETIVRSAGWFWQHGKQVSSGAELPLNPKADIGDFKRICELVQGSAVTFQKRKEKLEQIKPVIYGNNSCCKADKSATPPMIDFHIYQEGKIEKLVPKDKTFMARYYYHDKDKVKHYLGSADFHKVDWRATTSTEQKKDKDGNTFNYAELIDFHSLISYSSGKVKFKFIPGALGSEHRYYVDIDAFACLLGAMIEESIEDLAFNGFSKIDGDTGKPSKSHKNGMIGDFRYLNKKKDGTRTYVSIEKTNLLMNPNLDYERQVKFNNALYKFGYSQYHNGSKTVKMLSNTFIKDGINTELPHIDTDPDHYDHLHVQGLKLSSVLTVKAK